MNYLSNKNPVLDHLSRELVGDCLGKVNRSNLLQLEAWRRGLRLNLYKNNKLFQLSSNEKVLNFRDSFCTDYTEYSHLAKYYCKYKQRTKEILSKSGINVPEGKAFGFSDKDEEIIDYSETLGYPLVIKPVGEALGKGAVANIVDSAHFVKSLQHVRDKLGYREILVEKYIVGKEYRVYVLGNEVVGSIERTIPSVTGDGVNDVEELIRKKNEDRKNNLYLCKHPIKIDDEILGNLDQIGYTLRSVPRASEFVLLRNKPSPVAGGESIEVSDILPEVVKKQAIKAVGCIPGLEFAGLDMICNFDDLSNPGCIIEINHMPMYDNVVFPVYGEPRDIPSALLDYYFPESIINRNNQRNLYLDLKSISNYIQEGMIKELIVEPAPEKELLCSKIMLYGKVHRVGYRSWIKKKAIANKIHGHAINHKDGSIEVLVAGSDQKVVDQFIALCKEGSKKAKVSDVTVEEYTGPIKIGFHIIEKEYDEQRKKLKKETNDLQFYENELRESKHKLVKIKRKLRKIKRKYKAIKQSRSWRYTELIRKTFSKLHRRQ